MLDQRRRRSITSILGQCIAFAGFSRFHIRTVGHCNDRQFKSIGYIPTQLNKLGMAGGKY